MEIESSVKDACFRGIAGTDKKRKYAMVATGSNTNQQDLRLISPLVVWHYSCKWEVQSRNRFLTAYLTIVIIVFVILMILMSSLITTRMTILVIMMIIDMVAITIYYVYARRPSSHLRTFVFGKR